MTWHKASYARCLLSGHEIDIRPAYKKKKKKSHGRMIVNMHQQQETHAVSAC